MRSWNDRFWKVFKSKTYVRNFVKLKKHSLSPVFQYFSYWRRVPKTETYSCHFLSWRIFNILISHLEKWIEKSEFCRQSIRIIWKVIWCRCGGLQWCWSREFSQKCPLAPYSELPSVQRKLFCQKYCTLICLRMNFSNHLKEECKSFMKVPKLNLW